MSKKDKSSDSGLRAVLIAVVDDRPQELIKLRRDATIFGREKGDIIIDDNEVSSTHCQIQNISDVYHVFDMNSTNGTFVNNQRIIKARLKVGDVVTIGQTSFRFSLEDEKSVRHIATIFKNNKRNKDKSNSIVDTLIQSELRSTQSSVIKIDVTYGNGTNEVLELRQRVIYIGRASSFGQFDEDTEISRKHLLIKLNDTGEVFAEDQGSTNGSFLNGQKMSGMHKITDGDEVRIGGCKLKILAKAS